MNIFSLSYWFGVNPPPFMPVVERALLVVFAVWTLGGIVAFLILLKQGLEKTTKELLGKIAGLLTWSGLTALILWAFEYERIPVLSMRIFFVLWLVWVAIGLYGIYRYAFVTVPNMRKLEEERNQQNKWIPKRRK